MDAVNHHEFYSIHPDRWNKLAKLPTQRHCWFRACLETINADDNECLITFGDALAPFVRKRNPDRLTFIGDAIFEPCNVLSDGDTIEGLVEAIVKVGLPLHLSRVPADAPIISALKRRYWRGSPVVWPRPESCPYIELNDTWTEPERHFSSSSRSSFRKRRRKAENIGQVSFDILAPKPAEVSALFDEVVEVEAAAWMKTAGVAMAASSWRYRFYKRFAKYAAGEGILRLCFLRIEGRPVAMQYAVEFGGRFFGLKIAFDQNYAHISPGNLLRLEIIRDAANRGLQSYEFQGTDAPWTYLWTSTGRPMVYVEALHPTSVIEKIYSRIFGR